MALGLDQDTLVFEFPDLHEDAVLHVSFQRTLRVPDDAKRYGLPPGLGRFPVRAIDDIAEDRLPPGWKRHGGVVLPMWQAEACWVSFASPHGYPMLLKLAAGKINAITGAPWADAVDFPGQDYCEVPGQPWLDGFCVGEGVVRQFVAMPLGQGYTAEEQVTGRAEHGGMQLLVHPMKAAEWTKRKREREEMERAFSKSGSSDPFFDAMVPAALSAPLAMAAAPMGLAPGGSITQKINEPSEMPRVWDMTARSRCFVHIANSLHWRAMTGEAPPTVAPTAADYTRAGLPWFDWYDDAKPAQGSSVLSRLKSVFTLGREKGETPLPENESFDPPEPIRLGPKAPRPIRSKF